MKILIDDGLSLGKKLTGIGWYTKEVIKALEELGVSVEQPTYPSYFQKLPGFFKRILYLNYYVKKNIIAKEYDYIHYTNFFVPSQKHIAKVIVTIHDLSPFFVPETFPLIYRRYAKRSIQNSVKYGDKVLTVSDSVATELKEMFPEYANKVTVLYNLIKFPLSTTNIVKCKNEKTFLYVGVIEKRKNLKVLCDAFNILSEKYKDVKLNLIGKPGYGFNDIQKEISKNKSIVYKNYVSEEELLNFYKKATAFIFPSIYEGFGIPLIEAMSFNLPIIASYISTNIEINNRHSNKFILFEKNNINDLVCAMEKLYLDEYSFIEYPDLKIYSPENFKEELIKSVYSF